MKAIPKNETQRERRGHAFYPNVESAPPLYATEGTPTRDKIVREHYFTGGWDWYVVEYNPEDGTAFGYAYNAADPHNAEWGYVDLTELEQVRVTVQGRMVDTGRQFEFSQPIERDLHWTPKPAHECIPGLR